MFRLKKQRNIREGRKRIAQKVKKRLALLITFLSAIVLVLTFEAGRAWWPRWLVEYSIVLRGVILFTVVMLILLSPVIVEASSNPRTLSGPGNIPGLGGSS